jgi:hypothetical protein
MFPTVPYLQHFFDASIDEFACGGLTKATYIVSLEHPRPMVLTQEPEPPALQANTLCTLHRAIRTELFTAIQNLALH